MLSSATVGREQAKLMQLEVYSLTSMSARKEVVVLGPNVLDLISLLISLCVSFSLGCSCRAATPSRTHSLPSHSWKSNPGVDCAALATCNVSGYFSEIYLKRTQTLAAALHQVSAHSLGAILNGSGLM